MSDIQQGNGSQAVDRKALLEEQFAGIETAQAAPAPKEDRPRDEVGRFAPKNADGSEKTAVQQAQPVQTPEQPVQEPAWKRPPASWKKDFHELYGSFDPKAQEYIWQREEQMRSGVEPLLPKAKFADEVNKALEPYMGTIRGLGIEPAAAVGALAKADHDLRNLPSQQKLAYAANLLASYGIDVRAFGAEGYQPQQQAIDPNYHQLQQEIIRLRGEWQSMTAAQQEAENQRTMAEINAFAAKHEHFETLRPTMAQLLNAGVASDMQDAYDKAVRLTPEVFDAMQAAKQAEQQRAQIKSRDSAAKAAKAAAVSVPSSTPGAPTSSKAQTRREMLSEAFASMDSRF